ncbi:UNVERIFIED_CONTAM: hypothetical protein RMT77_002356 [Armadillidium vulgare]
MGRRRRIFFYICFFPLVLSFSYLLCVYSVYKRNAIYYESHFERLGDPFWLNHPRTYNRFREPHFGSHFIGGEVATKLKPQKDEKFIVVTGNILSNEGEYLGGYRTDVDKTEERKKKKKKEKYKKELKEKCRIDKKACEELKYLLDPKISFTDIDRESFFKSENDSQDLIGPSKPDWNSYADKGFAIVGKQGTLLRRLPHVLIIGAKKAGTRALLEFLRLHPSIAAAGAELHFFDRFFYKGPSWYRSRLPMSLEGQLTVEKTPAYFVDKDVPERVKKVLPTVRLLLVVRDPVIRAISDYTQSMSKHNSKLDFRSYVLKNSTSGLVNVVWGPIRGGLYARHYQRWRKFFPATSIHVVSGENLVQDPAEEMASVQDFLNLERVIKDRHFYFNATKGFPCLVKSEKNGKPHCLGFSKGRTHPKVDSEVIQILRDFYRPFNAKFYKLVGRDFGWQ